MWTSTAEGGGPSRMAFTHIGELTGHRGTHWHGAHLDVWGRLANRRGTNTVHNEALARNGRVNINTTDATTATALLLPCVSVNVNTTDGTTVWS